MANNPTHLRTFDPDGVYYTAGYTLDTAATLTPAGTATIIRPLGIIIGQCVGTTSAGKITITNGADVVAAAFGFGTGAANLYVPLSAIPQMMGCKIVLNSIAGTNARISVTFSFKYMGGTAPTVL